ncbi:ChaN family lipoprotein [Desulfosoma sp.]
MSKYQRLKGRSFLAWVVLAALYGCAALERPESAVSDRVFPRVLQAGDVLDLHTGTKLSFEELIRALETVRIVYVGEVHAREADHEVQQRIVEGLWKAGKRIGIGVEMLPRTVQAPLDLWVRGTVDEAEFLEAVGWERHWGFPFEAYRPVFVFAREKNIPMRALNAPPAVARKVAHHGLEALAEEERRQIARHFFMDDAAHRAYIQEEFKAHVPGGIKDFETFYQAQLVWDETMAESLAVWLVQEPLDQVVVLAGKAHVNQRFGIPERVRRRLEHRYAVVVPAAVNEAPEQVTAEVGDYLVVTAAEKPAPGHGKRLGVLLDKNPEGRGLRVRQVVPGSRAEKAGFLAGDLIVAADGDPVSDVSDLHRRFQSPQDAVVFTVDREGRVMEIRVDFGR